MIAYEEVISSLEEQLNTAAESERKFIEEQVNTSTVFESILILKNIAVKSNEL